MAPVRVSPDVVRGKNVIYAPRMRTRSAGPSAWLFKTGVASSPLCPTCHMTESIKQLLDVCAVHLVPRDIPRHLISVGKLVQQPWETIVPTGNIHRSCLVQRDLIAFI